MSLTTPHGSSEGRQPKETEQDASGNNKTAEAYAELEQGVYAALETYSNVHRGSEHKSLVSTHLYELARDIVLDYLGLKKGKYIVIFCTLRRAEMLRARLRSGSFQCVSGREIGLSLGLTALVVERKALPRGIPFQTGGGTARLVSPGWVVWAKALGRITGKPSSPADRHSAPVQDGTHILVKADVRQQVNDFVSASARRVYSPI